MEGLQCERITCLVVVRCLRKMILGVFATVG